MRHTGRYRMKGNYHKFWTEKNKIALRVSSKKQYRLNEVLGQHSQQVIFDGLFGTH